jgi:hypothetical protein
MKNKNNENLSMLLAQFFDAKEATKVAADIAAGDGIFDTNPAPKPSPALLADIKRQMMAMTYRKHHHWTSFFTRRIAAAAVILLVLGAGITLLQRHGPSLTSESFWQDTLENSLDAQLFQLESTDNDAPVITLEASGADISAMNDLVDDLDDIQGTFWEG